jgi:hypothetical protein
LDPLLYLETWPPIYRGGGEERKPGPGCGHEDFIGREDLERREHLIRDDSILIRCDVDVT